MKLWLLRPIEWGSGPWLLWEDKTFGYVVRAETERDARDLADKESGDEFCGTSDEHPWLNPELSSCDELTADGEPGIILQDLARG